MSLAGDSSFGIVLLPGSQLLNIRPILRSISFLFHADQQSVYSPVKRELRTFAPIVDVVAGGATSFIAITPSDSGSCREYHRKRVTGLCGVPWRQSCSAGNPVPVAPIAGLRLSGGQYLAKQCIS